jgi:hypothetical protein
VSQKSAGFCALGDDMHRKSLRKFLQVFLRRVENPFLRSGLALAGVNRSLSRDGVTDGILTAEKILGLNLRGTDMVVL